MHRVTIAIIIAATLWFVMFSPYTSSFFPFWGAMAVSAAILLTVALSFGGVECMRTITKDGAQVSLNEVAKSIAMGLVIAAVLWCVFWVGDKCSQLILPFARSQVNLIYDMKSGESPLLLTLLLLFLIGPAEEIFWRGYIQRSFASRFSPLKAFIITTAIYSLVHLPSCNFMLIMSALTCGIVWGGLYYIWPRQLPAIIISHAVWDAAAFVWFPL
ncbi:MAG: CPBP family intramembrane metalloprotease [Bacteroidaceae bacterium]|nr:CPBP family intramembrane metalloprotease [Bacteroidaceae bacterium]